MWLIVMRSIFKKSKYFGFVVEADVGEGALCNQFVRLLLPCLPWHLVILWPRSYLYSQPIDDTTAHIFFHSFFTFKKGLGGRKKNLRVWVFLTFFSYTTGFCYFWQKMIDPTEKWTRICQIHWYVYYVHLTNVYGIYKIYIYVIYILWRLHNSNAFKY